MIFTPGQLMVLIIFTEIMIYATLVAVTNTIRHCAIARAYRKIMEKGMITPNEFRTIINKEIEDDEKKKSCFDK